MIYKKYFFLIFVLFNPLQSQDACHLNVQAQHHAAMQIKLFALGKGEDLTNITSHIKKSLEFTGQFQLNKTEFVGVPSKHLIKELWAQHIPYALFIDQPKANSFGWRLYDTQTAAMIAGKQYQKRGDLVRGWAYQIADAIWPMLTGKPGFFSTKIAYAQEVPHGKYSYKHLYVADFDGSNPEPLVSTPTVNVAPRWNRDANRPLLFYSENTNKNMRMMASTMDKKHILASNFDGLNMQPTFNEDGSTVIYCATRAQGNCQLYRWSHKSLKKLTDNEGNNIFPCLSPDGKKLYFCSDFEAKLPQIYELEFDSGKLNRLTTGGFCVSPTVNASGQVAYSKSVSGVMQLFVYDPKTQNHKQLTLDPASKSECIWSPCGTYLMCQVEKGEKSRIAYFNVVTGDYRYLTADTLTCSYPAWSGSYLEYPRVS